MREIWKPIIGYEKQYEASTHGKIRSIPRNGTVKGKKLLSLNLKKSGYVDVTLTKDGKHTTFHVHQIIAKTFIDNPENKPQVNHKNGDKTDNRVKNLEWVTSRENIRHKFDTLGCKATRCGMKPVMCVETGEVFDAIKSAERKYGKSFGAIQRVANLERRTAYGLHWVFVDNVARNTKGATI